MRTLTKSLLLCALASTAACGSVNKRDRAVNTQEQAAIPTFTTELVVRDEDGQPISGATATVPGQVVSAGTDGRIVIPDLSGPAVALVGAQGFILEVVPLDVEATEPLDVRLWKASAQRWVMHSAGDVMFGRRYEEPPEGEPLIPRSDPGNGAVQVVSDISPAFSAADFRTVNLETVVSDLPYEEAYPRKRFILRSRPETLLGVRALEADAAILANNHARDFLDVGIEDTLASLLRFDQPGFGAAPNEWDAYTPYTRQVKGLRVGVLAYTTVNGDFVNDNYPGDRVRRPADLPESEAWQYEARAWEFDGEVLRVTRAARRMGEAWRLFAAAENEMSLEERDEAWASLLRVYPELQDWTARRGHGGAAEWREEPSREAIRKLRASVDVLIVQLHGGFQFQEAYSRNARQIAHAAIDEGADIVIGHHPHVLQGVEWYNGRLIAYSLGNFVFDQDFLSTFPTGFLRTVWEGRRMLEARLVPAEIIGYRPRVVTGHNARLNLLRIWERSLLGAVTERSASGAVRAFALESASGLVPGMRITANTALLTQGLSPVTETVRLEAGATVALSEDRLIDSRAGAQAGVWVGRDMFGWGHFEDVAADEKAGGGAHWTLSGRNKGVVMGDAYAGKQFLQLRRDANNRGDVLARPRARIPLTAHRLYGTDERPLDPDAEYTVRLAARKQGGGRAFVRLDIYHFDDTNPTEDPESTLLDRVELPLTLQDDRWQTVELDVSRYFPETGLTPANAVLLYVGLSAPEDGSATLDIDELVFVEWRPAAAMPARFGKYDYLRNRSTAMVDLAFEAAALSAPAVSVSPR